MKFRLKMNGSQKRLAEKRFRLMWRVHNQLAKHANSLINRMRHSRKYKQLAKAYKAAKEAGDDALRRALGDEMDAMRRQIGLTETAFEKYASVMQKRYSHHLSSHQVQKEADRVWQAAEAVIFRGGGRVNLKRLDGFLTISSKSQNGCHYADPLHPGVYKNDKILYPTGQVTWMGEPIKVDIPWHDQYTSFSLNHDLSYCEIHRGPFANGWHYYVILCLEGDAPVRFVEGDGTAGVDMGVSTACACSDDGILFDELVPRCREYNKAIGDEQRRIESSRRALNPGDYNADGTIKRGRHRWKISKRCRKHKWRKRDAHRRKRAYTKWSHSTQINRWLKKDRHFIAEGMDFRALAKRSKKDA